jgi:hypothetical protein
MKSYYNIILIAGAKWVMHQVAIGPSPNTHRVPLQVFWKVLPIDHRAVHNVTGYPRWIIDVLGTNSGLDAVCADESGTYMGSPVGINHGYARGVLVNPLHAGRSQQFYTIARQRCIEQCTVDIRSVYHSVGITEPFAKRIANVEPAHQSLVQGVMHDQFVSIYRNRSRAYTNAQGIECRKRIGPQLDAGTDFAELRRLLENFDGKPAARDR